MSHLDKEEDGAGSPGSRRPSLKTDPLSPEPGPLDSITSDDCEDRSLTILTPASSYLSLRSDCSRSLPGDLGLELGLSDSQDEESPPRCALCRDVPRDPVSTRCGPYWDQYGSAGDTPCPQCGQRPRTRAGLQTVSESISVQTESGLHQVLHQHKVSLRSRCQRVTEGSDETGSGTLLNRIFTDLYVTEGRSEEVNTRHEVWTLETASKIKKVHEAPIKCSDIFKVLPEQQGNVRVVMTNGVAGVGKTFLVQKFALDWAEGLENQDVGLLVLLSLRELNLIQHERYSLLTLLRVFHPTLQKVTAETLAVSKVLFIFDGLDESRLSLDFNNRKVVTDVTQESSVDLLLTNLIQGKLLPSALVWITSRPAAANQIPPGCVDRVTEVRGFTDAQKEEYFRRRFGDEERSSRIISHIKTSRSLHIMCQIPVFCWISATVLDHMLTTDQEGELPKTLTDMYSHFLLVQTKRKKYKYDKGHKTGPQKMTKADREVLLKLGRLAFEHLERGNIMFYQDDLERCGLDVTEASVYSGVCTEIFKPECVIFQKTVYCFVHLSIQEFLAAVFNIHCYNNGNSEVLENFLGKYYSNSALDVFLKDVMEKSLHSENGHLDLFVRFLHGFSVESNQRLLGGLLGRTKNFPEIVQAAIDNLKEMNSDNISPDRSINIFHCLMEMKDHSVHQEIQEFLKTKNRSDIHCSALAYVLQMSEEVLDELDLEEYNAADEGKRRLIPAVRNCRKARLPDCGLSDAHCAIVASALESNPSHLTELDLSHNDLLDSIMELLSAGLASPGCRLETLRLMNCSLSKKGCRFLARALESNPSHLTELELSGNYNLKDSGVKLLCGFLGSPDCSLETLRLRSCGLSSIGCASLVAVLRRRPLTLTDLDLRGNRLRDPGVKLLCGFLGSPDCRLEALRLSFCGLSAISCLYLVCALESNPSHLKVLELSGNRLQDSGVKLLCGFLESPDCRLQILCLWSCGLSIISCASLVSALKSNPSRLLLLDLSGNDLRDAGVKLLCSFLQSPECRLEILSLWSCGLSRTSCASLVSALRSRPSQLVELELSDNRLQDSGVKLLCGLLQSPACSLETLRLRYCGLSGVGCASLASALKSNSCQLLELDLRDNNLADSAVKDLCDLWESPDCALQTLRFNDTNDIHRKRTPDSRLKRAVAWIRGKIRPAASDGDADAEPDANTADTRPDDAPLRKLPVGFIPELQTQSAQVSYRFRCPGPGEFRCALTGLVFVVDREAELVYRTVQWDKSLLRSAGRTAAGPLFKIHCPEDAVRQLHLPHCETKEALLSEGLLSVVHIAEDGMSVVEPLQITDTHVIVRVPHLSCFGIVWFRNRKKKISGQVLLFLRPPNPRTQRQYLNVLLLPSNVPLDEVKAKQQHCQYIQAPPKCKLVIDQSYSVHCPAAYKIQPQKEEFDLDFGPNYHPTFEIRLPTNTEEAAIAVRDLTDTTVWEREVDLTGRGREEVDGGVPVEDGVAPENRLLKARSKFVNGVSEPVLDQLLDKLLERGVMNDDEMRSAKGKLQGEKARNVIDTVRRKGTRACSVLIGALCEADPHLSRALELR